MKSIPYWQDTAEAFAGAETGPVEGRVDVAVVGGGFTGLSAALALARKGASVAVLEAERVGGGASGRNGGHVNNGTAQDFAGLAGRLGLPHAQRLYRAFDEAVDTVERIVAEEQIRCDFRRCGKIKLAAKPAHYEAIARGTDLLACEADPDVELVPRSGINAEVGSSAFHGGLLYRKAAQMHMGRFAAGLAGAARRHGARVFEHAAVTGLARNGQSHRVTTSPGTVEAKQLFLATGPSLRGPFFHLRRRIVPVGSFIIVTEKLTASQLDSIMPTRRNATTTLNIGNYFRISPDDRLIWGGRARFALSSPTSDAKSGLVLQRQLRAVFPQLGDVRIDYCWGGIVDMTADRLPRAGEHQGAFYAMDYSGHGAQMSVHMGRVMARLMDGDAASNPFRDLPWPPVPGHFGPPWFLPAVGLYHRLKDAIS